MSLILLESFDMVADTGVSSGNTLQWLGAKGWVSSTFASGSLQIVPGRLGGQGLKLNFTAIIGGANFSRQVAPAQEHTTFTVGFALHLDKLDTPVIQIMSDELSTVHARLTVGPGGQLHIYAGTGLPLVGSSSIFLTTGIWNYIEISLTLSNTTTGSMQVHVNGGSAISATGIETKNGGTKTTLDSIQFYTDSTLNTIDDLYLTNGAGSTNNTFLGDVTVLVIRPAATGDESQLTNSASTSVNNFSYVNSILSQTVTYVQTDIPGDEDTYQMTSLDFTGAIYGLQTVALSDKNNSQSRSIVPVIREAGTDHIGSASTLAMNSPQYATEIFEIDPGTSAAWTFSGINSAQFGNRIE